MNFEKAGPDDKPPTDKPPTEKPPTDTPPTDTPPTDQSPGYPPSGYPPPGGQYGQQQYPPPAYGYPPPGYPPPGYPPPGYPPPGYPPPGYPTPYGQAPYVAKPTGWFIVNWLFFWPTAIYSLVTHWNNIDRAAYAGDFVSAQAHAASVRKFGIFALCLSLALFVLFIVLEAVVFSAVVSRCSDSVNGLNSSNC